MKNKCLQETYAEKSICFGCGPANKKGLRIQSFVEGDLVVAKWSAEKHHEAFPGVLNGGIIGTLLDCHCNWAGAYYLMQSTGEKVAPSTVTAEYSVKLLRPTPSRSSLFLSAKLIELDGKKAVIEGELKADGKICAICTGIFVSVGPGHPGYHRW
ncbi:MAG: PaaI family thioesterase [Candidatus Marinimicrobia bacterium]|jgi:acyl-coenzyme A thioesterase PaaI-like protein|nr:PaaI family thioesterase [Candidatus Neomarinimicrobiota bacterium]MBT3617878.1 PaaI family thioesterase [Candidatus Neomarinimicrobiota bacterium]MBT3828715.1 PaaI family thioesterase [Candidatus Neomarinimicrobiota bacterium]MBT3996663.1 PaaI family thioesterase [Candidatus Neomarinimicrobiota bacterium]MBT4280417.1 PaaI family thioesterase [Candidatus Neomarinimicrobiota bacterium]